MENYGHMDQGMMPLCAWHNLPSTADVDGRPALTRTMMNNHRILQISCKS